MFRLLYQIRYFTEKTKIRVKRICAGRKPTRVVPQAAMGAERQCWFRGSRRERLEAVRSRRIKSLRAQRNGRRRRYSSHVPSRHAGQMI
jgi:hypothetical protein